MHISHFVFNLKLRFVVAFCEIFGHIGPAFIRSLGSGCCFKVSFVDEKEVRRREQNDW